MSDLITHPIPYISAPEEISNEEYHKGVKYKDFISSTTLKWYYTSPKYYDFLRRNPDKAGISEAAAMQGSVYHDMLSSLANTGTLDNFEKSWFVFEPPINPTTNKSYGIDTAKYQNALIEARFSNPGKECTSENEVNIAKIMINELLHNNYHYSHQIRKFLEWGKAEQSCFCEYRGGKFKIRTDLMTKRKIIDWKGVAASDLHENTIAKIILNFDYHISAAMYQFFYHEITGEWKEFYWVFQQKQEPYDAVIVSAEDWAYQIEIIDGKQVAFPKVGAMLFRELLEHHLWCLENQEYPGASIFVEPDFLGNRVMKPEVPGYYKNQMFKFYNK